MEEKKPRVSVIMPAYNSEQYIGEAITSIINQSFMDWELIIVNDGSRDSTADVISSFADERIVFVNNEVNSGFVPTLNYAISLSKGEYIARLDDDDIAYSWRIMEQVKYLDEHEDVVLVGGNLDLLIDGRVEKYTAPPINTDAEIRFSLMFGNYVMGHSSFMFRRSVFDEKKVKYDTFIQVPDHHIQLDTCKYGKLAVLNTSLFQYRIHKSQSTAVRSIEMKQNEEDRCRCLYIDEIDMSSFDKDILKRAVCRDVSSREQYIELDEAVGRYAEKCGIPEHNIAVEYVYTDLIKQQKYSLITAISFILSPHRKRGLKGVFSEWRFLLCCIIGRNKNYIKSTVNYSKTIEREIYPSI